MTMHKLMSHMVVGLLALVFIACDDGAVTPDAGSDAGLVDAGPDDELPLEEAVAQTDMYCAREAECLGAAPPNCRLSTGLRFAFARRALVLAETACRAAATCAELADGACREVFDNAQALPEHEALQRACAEVSTRCAWNADACQFVAPAWLARSIVGERQACLVLDTCDEVSACLRSAGG